jgi:hypothetical protein
MSGPEDEPLSLEAAAGLLGAYCALERALFELTGVAAVDPEAPPSVSVALSSWSTEHAWHAELFADRLPVTAAIDPGALVVLPAPLGGAFERLAAAAPLARLAGLVRVVLPRLLVAYGRHLAAASAVADGPTRRALTLVVRDEREEWGRGEALLQGLLSDREAVGTAGRWVVELEKDFVQAGPGIGLVPWPGRRA